MTNKEIIEKTAAMVKEKFQADGSGHDWWHIYRVWQMAKTIATGEKADFLIVELGALLHDIGDYKFNDGDELIGGKLTREWLSKFNLSEEILKELVHIVDNVSFKGGNETNKMQSNAGKIIQDADRLDAVGAIGIARCFAYGGAKGRIMYDPDKKPNMNMTKEEYMNSDSASINHFYEKLLRLKDMMNTETGKKMAQHRHEYLEQFLEEFYSEWEGQL